MLRIFYLTCFLKRLEGCFVCFSIVVILKVLTAVAMADDVLTRRGAVDTADTKCVSCCVNCDKISGKTRNYLMTSRFSLDSNQHVYKSGAEAVSRSVSSHGTVINKAMFVDTC